MIRPTEPTHIHAAGTPDELWWDGAAWVTPSDTFDAGTTEQAFSDGPQTVAGAEIRAFIERAERLDAEKADILEAIKEVFAEAKGRGYDVKVLKKIIAIRKRDANDLAEEEAIAEMYKEALGM